MISSTLYFLLIQLNSHLPYPFLKVIGLQGRVPDTSAGNWFQCWMVYTDSVSVPLATEHAQRIPLIAVSS